MSSQSAATSMDLPMDWENAFTVETSAIKTTTESIPDALVMSLKQLGRVDLEFIAATTGKDFKVIIPALEGSIYQNPEKWNECFYRGWETADEYLSGNLMRKLRVAEQANKDYDNYFASNVQALKEALPAPIPLEDIYVTPGAPWIPPEVIEQFIIETFGDPIITYRVDPGPPPMYLPKYASDIESYRIKHDGITGAWEIPYKNRFGAHDVASTQTYGTKRANALWLLEQALNLKPVAVYDQISTDGSASSKSRVLNQSETNLAIEKQTALITAFQQWIWEDPIRAEALKEIYDERFGYLKQRRFDGSFLDFPTMNPEVQLRPYQKNAVARIIFTSNTLLAHKVGAGKTYIMIAAGMELRRIGLSSKNMYVVPNNIVGQWQSIFKLMYPQANVLCVGPKSFKPSRRQKVLETIRDQDFDAIIIAYSCFERIPLSRNYYEQKLRILTDRIEQTLADNAHATSKLKRKHKSVQKALQELVNVVDEDDDGVHFDELGISRLFIDEAHNFKNVPFETDAVNVLGINAKGSKKCQAMYDKVHLIESQSNGGVVFATGTPITNSVTDIFIMQKYLQNSELKLLDIQNFDGWANMFAEQITEFEIDVDTSTYRLATRFARFHNLPELTTLLAFFADFYDGEDSEESLFKAEYLDTRVPRGDAFASYLEQISQRADAVRCGAVKRSEDNMLKITTDGRLAALDMRLVDGTQPYEIDSKVTYCAENVAHIYKETTEEQSAQIVFCDTSTPKASFNIYDELRRILVLCGVDDRHIAYIHDAKNDRQRRALFRRTRNGQIRVLIGSTFKLGLGVNIQERLIALHHIDVPWRPADMIQREGRILREGNLNSEVKIFRYVTEGSFDAYSWQLLETKARFIDELLSGSYDRRSGGDIDDTALKYAEVKALAVGNGLVKQRVETANELTRLRMLKKKDADARAELTQTVACLPEKIRRQTDLIEKCETDIGLSQMCEALHPAPTVAAERRQAAEDRKRLRERIFKEVLDYAYEIHEKTLLDYRGFSIVLPSHLDPASPSLYLMKIGRYIVHLGTSDKGLLRRIDNVIDGLPKRLEKLRNEKDRLEHQLAKGLEELNTPISYDDEIEKLEALLDDIDEALGVKDDL